MTISKPQHPSHSNGFYQTSPHGALPSGQVATIGGLTFLAFAAHSIAFPDSFD